MDHRAPIVEQIRSLVDPNLPASPGATLGLSRGSATAGPGERQEAVLGRADETMQAAKPRFRAATGLDRRSPPAGRAAS